MFTWLRQKMTTVYRKNVMRNIKASSHPEIVYKLAILMELINTLDRSPMYRRGQTFFDVDTFVFNIDSLAENLSLIEYCLRIQNAILLTPVNTKTLLSTPPSLPANELDVLPQDILTNIRKKCESKFYWGPSYTSFSNTNFEINDDYWVSFHQRINRLFEQAVDTLASKDLEITVHVHQATTVELDYLMALHEGLEPKITIDNGKKKRYVSVTRQVIDREKTHDRELLRINLPGGPGWYSEPIFKDEEVRYSPSTDWAVGGPLFDKYDLELTRLDDDFIEAYAYHDEARPGGGPTRLMAGMRTILRTTYGEGKRTVPGNCALSRIDGDVWELFEKVGRIPHARENRYWPDPD